jgi:cation/acetate symporter
VAVPGLTDGIANISAAIVGLPVGVIVTIVVSKMTKEPSKEMQDFIDEVRRPSGETIMQEKTA